MDGNYHFLFVILKILNFLKSIVNKPELYVNICYNKIKKTQRIDKSIMGKSYFLSAYSPDLNPIEKMPGEYEKMDKKIILPLSMNCTMF